MEEPFSYRLGLTLARFFAVFMVLIAYSEVRAKNQDLASTRSSPCLANNSSQNFSFIGKAIYAECFCKQSIETDELRMCVAWKLSYQPPQETSNIKIFNKYSKMVMCPSQAVNSKSCENYLQTIRDIYGSTDLNFSTVQEAISYSINWDFCEDMQTRNNTGCNYTIVQASGQNNSSATELHYFVPSFKSTAQHLRLGNFYRLNFEKYNGTVANICVSALDDYRSQLKTTVDFLFSNLPTKRTKSGISTRSIATNSDKDWRRNNSMHGALTANYTYTLYAAIFLASLLTF